MLSERWIVGSDVATTCTSRIAMNMPMHIIAKPVQVATDTETVAWPPWKLDAKCESIPPPRATRTPVELLIFSGTLMPSSRRLSC